MQEISVEFSYHKYPSTLHLMKSLALRTASNARQEQSVPASVGALKLMSIFSERQQSKSQILFQKCS